jgi:hypothetical protein
METANEMLTVGAIARRLNKPVHRIQYVIASRHILPIGMAGNLRVFSEADVQQIASEIRRIEVEREGGCE